MIKFDTMPHAINSISSPFGPRSLAFSPYHYGVDIRPKTRGKDGDPIFAVAEGTVMVAKTNAGGIKCGYGFYVIIEHAGFCTLYGHLHEFVVAVGQKVKPGTVIGHMGNTGSSTGTHLHFSLINGPYSMTKNKKYYINPLPFLRGARVMTPEEAKQIIKEHTGFSPDTMKFLETYKYADELLIRLAKAMQ